MAVIQMSDAPTGPPPVMTQGMTKLLRLATSSSSTVTVITPFRCGTVTCQNCCHGPAPSTVAARSNWSGTVCSPANIMIIAKENSFQTFTTMSDGSTVSTLSRKLIGWSVSPSATNAAPITPKSLWYSQRQTYAAATPLITYGTSRIPRMTPRPTN